MRIGVRILHARDAEEKMSSEARLARYIDRTAVRHGYGADDVQAQSRSVDLIAHRAASPEERFEHSAPFLGWYPRPPVGNFYLYFSDAFGGYGFRINANPAAAVTHGVVEQVAQRLVQRELVSQRVGKIRRDLPVDHEPGFAFE